MKHNPNTPLRIAAILLVFALFTSGLVTGTIAKYYTSAGNIATRARVAAFRVQVWNGTEWVELNSTAFTGGKINLYDTLYEADVADAEEYSDTGNVYASNTDKIIAPGTGGTFQVTVKNLSEVGVAYNLSIGGTGTTTNIPIEVSTDGGTTWLSISTVGQTAISATGTLAPLSGPTSATTAPAAGDGSVGITVKWRWVYEKDTPHITDGTAGSIFTDAADSAKLAVDDADNALGKATQLPTLTLPITLSAVQVD
ncbi:MAG: hypothetical protein LBR73_07625 [Oscillospiraceae bacterium]|jgi:hypothetical protein|nr:hypothetical protein [Oscillospiraceae bacterium]